MKSCPACQQVYPDSLEVCPDDGARLMVSDSAYAPGSSDYRFQTPSGQYLPPTQDWQPPPTPPGWGYYPPGQYPPYGYGVPYTQSAGGEGLATAALYTGISTVAALLLGFLLVFSSISSFPPNPALVGMGGILILLSFLVGLTALILGIVAASMSNRNPAISKAKAIVGLCFGAIPLLLLLIGLIAGSSFRRF
jgi:hypothetical protein